MRKFIAPLAYVIAVMFLVSGCASIPTSGGVQQGAAVIEPDGGSIEFLPAGPAANATQDQILRGFIDAASSSASDFAIAREYLTPEFAETWDATAGVQVDSGVRKFNIDAQSGTFLYNLRATVDSSGNYTQVTEVSETSQTYRFMQVDGQWRISEAPAGVIIDSFTFTQTYAPFPLYFLDSTNTVLVPDVRYFPSGASASTRIMKALLAGPSSWLISSGAVYSAFPPGTALVADTVPVTRGVATIDLNANALNVGELGMRKMKQQATASLLGVGDITSVELSIEGSIQEQVGQVSLDSVLPAPVDSRPLVMTENAFGYLTGNTVESIPAMQSLVLENNPQSIAVTSGVRLAAMLTSEGVKLVRSPGGVTTLDTRPNLISPSVDNFNFVWSVPSDNPTQLQVFAPDGRAYEITAPWTDASRIVSLSVSRDGARAVAIIETATGYSLVASAITRGDQRIPISFGSLKTLGTVTGNPLGITWVDDVTVATLATTADNQSVVSVVIVGGSTQKLAPISTSETVAVAGANTQAQIRVLTSTGALLSLRGGTTWQEAAQGIRTLAVQQ